MLLIISFLFLAQEKLTLHFSGFSRTPEFLKVTRELADIGCLRFRNPLYHNKLLFHLSPLGFSYRRACKVFNGYTGKTPQRITHEIRKSVISRSNIRNVLNFETDTFNQRKPNIVHLNTNVPQNRKSCFSKASRLVQGHKRSPVAAGVSGLSGRSRFVTRPVADDNWL